MKRWIVCAALMIMLGAVMARAAGEGAAQEPDKRLHSNGPGWGLIKAEIKDPSLPRVLLIGDSILNGYRATVVKELQGQANVDVWVNPFHQASGGLHQQLAGVLANGPYDVIHFNMGLHGWQKGRIPEGQFIPLTRKLVQTLREKAPGAELIWASSTPVTVKGAPGKLDGEINPVIVEHNAMAAQVMKAMGVPVNDLYQLMLGHLDMARGDQFHWKPEASQMQGNAVAQCVKAQLDERARAKKQG